MPLVFLTFALFASVFTVGKVALLSAPPFFLTGIRYLIAGSVLFLFQLYQGSVFSFSPFKHIRNLLIVGLFNVLLTNGFEFWGLQYMTSGKTSLIYTLSPFFALVFSYFVLSEKMTLKKWLGLFLGVAGFLCLFFMESNGDLGSFTLAEAAVTASAIFSVIGWVYFKLLVQEKGYPVHLANAYSFLIGGTIGLLISFFFEWEQMSISWTGELVFQLAYITIVHSLVCFSLYGYALKRFSVTFMAFAGILNPLCTALYGWIFLAETVGQPFFFCAVLVTVGLYVFYLEEKLNERVRT